VAEWSAGVDAFPHGADCDNGPGALDVRRAAMDLLARREHGSNELIHQLKKRFSSIPELIEEEVEKLKAEGLQSDSRLVEAFIRARVNRGQGPNKIKAELWAKGVDETIVAAALDEIDWFQLINEVASKRYGDTPPADIKERAKRGRFLLQRGFSFDHIRSLDHN